mmetsp:Transcript_118601/g.221636  ORF Transcript_118601/g.221636 Transcript_118601/m.221636 type:complete len:396 (+) Transcript_118601:25-1212(+)
MTELDPVQFIAIAGVDDRAKQKFLELHPDVQRGIVSRGPLDGARNPSAALIGRIRDSEKDQFIAEAGVDEDAAAAFGKLSSDMQKEVMSKGTFNGSKNPSAVLLGRIRDARKSANFATLTSQNFPWGAMMPSPPSGARWQSQGVKRKTMALMDGSVDVEKFIAEGEVDESAAQALRDLSPDLQAEVLSRGGLGSSRNPSAVLIGRVRDVKKGMVSMPRAAAWSPLNFSPPAVKARKITPTSAAGLEGPMDVESFIAEEGVDDAAANGLRELSPEMQQAIMSRGDLKGGRNPSAMLIGRIRDAKATFQMSDKVEQFIQEEAVDEKAANGLRELDPDMQERIIGRGTLAGGTNPSAMLIGRIAAAKKQSNMASFGGMPMMSMWSPMISPPSMKGRRW